MKDSECVQLLQWALPRLHMRWPGFRKVRAQVCKRIERRIRQLNIDGIPAYRAYLEEHAAEWTCLDRLTRITISRFYRDKAVFHFLERDVLPALAKEAIARNRDHLRVWSAGSASGEEPYTVALIWQFELRSRFPSLTPHIAATDVDRNMGLRAREACYSYSSIKDLPEAWRRQTFLEQDGRYCLKPRYRRHVEFLEQDIREQQPAGRFDLVLCRNVVFTYYDRDLQRKILDCIEDIMQDEGALVLGMHEQLPEGTEKFLAWSDRLRIYRKTRQR
jgi:chemotaxis protein methyltransferase CheR